MQESLTEQVNINVPVIKYRTFQSSELFEAWQRETNNKLIQIQPIITTAQAQQNTSSDIDMQLVVSVFVTYWSN